MDHNSATQIEILTHMKDNQDKHMKAWNEYSKNVDLLRRHLERQANK